MSDKRPKGDEPLPVPVVTPVELSSESESESSELAAEEEKRVEQNEFDRFIGILRKILNNENISDDDITFIEQSNGEPNFCHLDDELNEDAAFIFQVYIRHKIINTASEKERQQIIDKFGRQLYGGIGELSKSSKNSLNIPNYMSFVQNILTDYNNLNNGSSESKSSDEPPTKKAKHTDGIRKSKKRSRKSKRRSTKKSKNY